MQFVNLFVYGSLKRGYKNHEILKRCAQSIENGTIIGTLYDIKLGFPAVQLKGNYIVKGQLAKIPKQYLDYFDYFEGVPSLYQRSTVQVSLQNGKKETAYVYTMRVLPLGSTIVKNAQW